jgi:hypothetical protein
MKTPTTTPIKNINNRKLEFDKKLKQIENDELKLKTLESELLLLKSRIATESIPTVEEFCKIRFENLVRLREHSNNSQFKKKEKRQIALLMRELALGLKSVGDLRADEFLDDLIPEESAEVDKKKNGFDTQKFRPYLSTEKLTEGKDEIKSLYRQLAKAFHPDIEPLEHLKIEKTSLMKKITAAYENQDLSGLLKLEKDLLGPREFSEDKIDLYIKHINDRLKELKSFEAMLKKHGPLATIYRFIYSQKTVIQENNIMNELLKIENEVKKEKDLQQILWDSFSLSKYLKS